MKITGWVLLAIGAAVIAAGLLLGNLSVERGGVNCGSGLGGVSNQADAKDAENAYLGQATHLASTCQSAVSDRHTIALAAIVPGGILGFAGLLTLAAAFGRRSPAAQPAGVEPGQAFPQGQ